MTWLDKSPQRTNDGGRHYIHPPPPHPTPTENDVGHSYSARLDNLFSIKLFFSLEFNCPRRVFSHFRSLSVALRIVRVHPGISRGEWEGVVCLEIKIKFTYAVGTSNGNTNNGCNVPHRAIWNWYNQNISRTFFLGITWYKNFYLPSVSVKQITLATWAIFRHNICKVNRQKQL